MGLTQIWGKNSEKYRKFGKILWKIRKNTENSEKFGKILKIRKNTFKNSEKYFGKFGKILSKIRIPDAKSLFPTMLSPPPPFIQVRAVFGRFSVVFRAVFGWPTE